MLRWWDLFHKQMTVSSILKIEFCAHICKLFTVALIHLHELFSSDTIKSGIIKIKILKISKTHHIISETVKQSIASVNKCLTRSVKTDLILIYHCTSFHPDGESFKTICCTRREKKKSKKTRMPITNMTFEVFSHPVKSILSERAHTYEKLFLCMLSGPSGRH